MQTVRFTIIFLTQDAKECNVHLNVAILSSPLIVILCGAQNQGHVITITMHTHHRCYMDVAVEGVVK
jgi:uncharacterized integral membrane protein